MDIINSNLRFGSNIAYGNNPKEIILHHAEASKCSVEDIHSWHKNQGWAGIGYHYFIRKDGKIYKGRLDNAVGSHCLGHNKDTLGICFEGAYNEETMPQVQIQAGRELISYLKAKYNISLVKRHKDLNNTDCPGANFPFAEIINNSNVSSKPINNSNSSINNVDWLAEYLKFWNWTQWVKDLQSECNKQGFSNQPVDGICGTKTLEGCPTLKLGAKGNITRLLQKVLKAYGIANLKEDGIFGEETYKVVIAYQRAKGLTQDGIVGYNTWKKLLGL